MGTKQTKFSGNSYWSDVLYHTNLVVTNLNTSESYTEDTPLSLTDIVVSTGDMVTVTLTLSNTSAGSLNTATSGSVTSHFSSGTWSASGARASVNTLLAGLIFTPTTNFNSNFTIAVSITNDDDGSVLTGTKTVTGVAVNDAPTATNRSAAETYYQDTPLNLTDIVISDVDSASVTATLTLSTPSAGSLNTATSGAVTSTFNGSTGVWSASGAVANVNTLLAGLTFTPASSYHSNFTIAVSISDGTSTITGTKNMTGVAANNAPVLDATKSPTLVSVAMNAPVPTGAVGSTVSHFIDATTPAGGLDNVLDNDGNSLGAAITAADSTNGTWYYSINDGATWSALGAVSDSNARLLSSTARVYFKPNTSFTGTVATALTFRAWDQTSGTNGGTTNITSTGGTTAFSTATDTVSIQVTAS